jgi:tetratricopeptide (TPR) repeat protein
MTIRSIRAMGREAMSLEKGAAVLAALLLFAAVAPAVAQEWQGRGRIQGVVIDEQGKPVEKAKVSFLRGEQGPKPTYTDAKGRWAVGGLGQGEWKVLIEKDGFQLSEGTVRANEFGSVPPVNVTLKKVVMEAQAQTKGSEAVGYIQKGNELLTAQKYAEARAEYEKAIPLLDAENQPAVQRGIAMTLYQEGKVEPAVEVLKTQVLVAKPDDPQTLQLLVNWLVGAGREEEAKQYIARLPQGTTVDPNSLLNLGIKAYNDQKLDDAAGYFNRVVQENPQLPDAYYYRGLVFLAQSKTAEAKADFQKVLEIDPGHAKADEVREFLKSL